MEYVTAKAFHVKRFLSLQGFHIGTKELEEMGRCFCAGLLKLGNSSSITALLGTIPKLSMDEREPEDDIL